MKWQPHKYQQKAIKFGISRENCGFFLAPGLGKSSITLAIYKILKKQGFVDSMLVLAPLRAVYSVWPKEAKKWEEFNNLRVGILHGPNKEEVLSQDHDVYVMNYEGLEWLCNCGLPRRINMLVVDESSKLKNIRTNRFKILKLMLPKFKRRYLLTGSPAANSLMDLFGQCYVMDRGESFGPYITHFRSKYFNQVGYNGYEYEIKPGADKKIFSIIAPRVMHMSAEDYLELPELLIRDVYVDMPDKSFRIYKQMENQLRVDFESGVIRSANAAVASMKCRQIASGGLYLDDGSKNWEHIHDAKTDAVKDIVEELQGKPVLIAYEFLHDLDRLRKALGKEVPHIGSGVSPAKGRQYEEEWNKGRLPILLGHPQSMAHALNLQGTEEEGGTIVIHSIPWSLELYEQLIRRVWRQGQKKIVIVHRIITRGTVDEAIIRALSRKTVTQESLFNSLKEYLNGKSV